MIQFKIKYLSALLSYTLIIGFFLVSCSPIKVTQLKGNYVCKRKNNPYLYSEITLNDTAFSYTYRAGLYYKESQGTWHIEGNNIILNSYDYCKNDYLIVEEKHTEGKPYIQLNLNQNEDKFPLPGWSIKINDSGEYLLTDSEGKIYFDKTAEIDTITVFSIGLSEKNSKYTIKDRTANIFEIELIMENQYIYFENEKMKRNGRFLKFTDYVSHLKYFKE
ncbi:hypothetical protein DVK85_05125 [Flavobacterium arcticum]|uniref:Uncharacterized protein n=1 Tax=Flavobacterium arcticum TaxID=1784713 RepID=A0A345HAN6_9FLAO|nr:hypothetical protein [Flavobacterium arcticum]AXG73646.1 hypothetical protein DVK85_05125 [Flavobacterium arcticum]KAF2511596.1 hypothetical protein E0W72_04635 [Flavobacterium arcticum]